ncbi:hypothetical protein DL765_010833 [Monosporascus sp. GIB2]|nr:hypothetical protein DL765_010833 [Monosporascus sp. GIB2]
MILRAWFLSIIVFASSVLAAFGFTKSGNNYVIDTGYSNPLVFTANGKSCDITSIKYSGNEVQDGAKGTHLSSGLGSANVNVENVSGSTKYVKVTCTTSTLIHYMVVKQRDSTIYLATHITAEPSIGELRFVTCLKLFALPNEHPFGAVSTTSGSSSTVEGSDVFVVNGQTRSKFHSSTWFMDRDGSCVYGGSGSDLIYACTLVSNFESSSGGPFFRDIETNNAGTATNLYFYMNSGHVQTEAFRTNVLHCPYMMTFLRNYQTVVHWYNSEAQYWTVASSSGSFQSPAMKPGTYTQVLSDRIQVSRNSQFLMAIFKSADNPVTIEFDLKSAPGAVTLRITTTLSFAGARPQAKVNSWSGPTPSAPSKIDSRGVTRGAYRGYGEVYDLKIPAGVLVAGSNASTISAMSGSSGSTYLGPNFIFDAVELFT